MLSLVIIHFKFKYTIDIPLVCDVAFQSTGVLASCDHDYANEAFSMRAASTPCRHPELTDKIN